MKPIKKILIFASAVVLAVVAGAAFYTGVNSYVKTVRPEDFVSYRLCGGNGYGSVECEIDEERLEEKLYKNAGINVYDPEADKTAFEAEYEKIKNSIELLIPDNKTLQNGDTVKVKAEYSAPEHNEVFGCKIAGGEYIIKVDGLPEPIEIDFFDEDYLSVSFEGYNGFGSFNTQCSGFMGAVPEFSADKSCYLKNDDKINISWSFEDGEYEKTVAEFGAKGYFFEKTGTKEYTVSGLEPYVTASDMKNLDMEYYCNLAISEVAMVNGRYQNTKTVGALYAEYKPDGTQSDYEKLMSDPKNAVNTLYIFVYYEDLEGNGYTGTQKISGLRFKEGEPGVIAEDWSAGRTYDTDVQRGSLSYEECVEEFVDLNDELYIFTQLV